MARAILRLGDVLANDAFQQDRGIQELIAGVLLAHGGVDLPLIPHAQPLVQGIA